MLFKLKKPSTHQNHAANGQSSLAVSVTPLLMAFEAFIINRLKPCMQHVLCVIKVHKTSSMKICFSMHDMPSAWRTQANWELVWMQGFHREKWITVHPPEDFNYTKSTSLLFSHPKKKIPFLAHICSKYERCFNERVVIERYMRLFQRSEHNAFKSEYPIQSPQLPHVLGFKVNRAGLVEHND